MQIHQSNSWSLAANDVFGAVRKGELITMLGWQDVATRYRRSRIGAFWLTINTSIMIGALGLVFGTLFGQPMREFLPYLAVGQIVWGFIAANINEGCTAFSSASGIVLQIKLPLWVHLARVMWKNLIILAHNAVIVPLVFLVLWHPISPMAFLAIPGIILIVANLLWMMMTTATLCTRFRDVTQIVSNTLQVIFYLTPVIWKAESMSNRVGDLFFYINPFYSLITIVRAPLLGHMPPTLCWGIASGLAVIGWTVALWLYGSRLKRVPYWL